MSGHVDLPLVNEPRTSSFAIHDAHSRSVDGQEHQRGRRVSSGSSRSDASEQDAGPRRTSMRHWRILLYCTAPFLTGAVAGYDSIANGALLSLPSFLDYFGTVDAVGMPYLPSLWTALWLAMSSLAQALGALGAGVISDRRGRKSALLLGAVISTVGVALQYTATTSGTLLAGKIVNGIAIGLLFTTGTTYASEISPLALRGPIQSCLIAFVNVMQMIGLGVVRAFVQSVDAQAFRTILAVQFSFSSLLLLIAPFIPESPTFLLQTGHASSARLSLVKLYGKDPAIDSRLQALHDTVKAEKASGTDGPGTFADCFRGLNRQRTMTAMFVVLAPQLQGCQLLTQNIYFLYIIGLPVVHAYDIGIAGFALAVILIASSWHFMPRTGRRVLLLSGACFAFVTMLAIGCLDYVAGSGPLLAIAVIMNVVIAVQALLAVSISWVIIPELSSFRLRSKTQALCVMCSAIVGWLFAFVTPYIYNVDQGNLGARTAFIYAATSLVFGLGTYLFVPETLGLDAKDLDHALKRSGTLRNLEITIRRAAHGNDATAAII